MRQSYFRPVGVTIFRASADGHGEQGALPWPNSRADVVATRAFVREAWAAAGFASAVELASPGLSAAVAAILRGDAIAPDKAARAALSLARYSARMRGRATPFGLFAGITLAHVGATADCTWESGGRAAGRADGRWLAAVVAALEACASLRRHLRVVANNLVTVRGDRLVVNWLPHASQVAWEAPAEVSLRRSPAVEAALRLARSPVTVPELMARLLAELAPATDAQIDTLIGELLTCGALVSSLRPPSTATDGLAHVLDALAGADATSFPDGVSAAALREAYEQLRCADATSFPKCADRMRALATSPAHPVTADLHLEHRVTVPVTISSAAAAAASALARLGPRPSGHEGWREYHTRFLERYGPGAAVPVTALVDSVTGLGMPAHYSAHRSPGQSPAGSGRDERLMSLAQQAALDGATEVSLDDAVIDWLAGSPDMLTRTVPHADITVEIQAASTQAVDAGEYTLVVTGTGRTAMATSGRFLHLLPSEKRARISVACRALPTATHGALPVQLSFPPHHVRAENVTRVPRLLPDLLSVAEHHEPGSGQVMLSDLAVTADLDRFYLLSLSRRVPVEPLLACAPAWHAVPPVARLLFELPRTGCAAVGLFDWGLASCLPFLPRLRVGNTVLSPARWRLRAEDLPGLSADPREWKAAVQELRQRLKLPGWVTVGAGDRQLRLNLSHSADLAILRAQLGSSSAPVVLTESWAPEDHAWCGGRAHEVVIPLAGTMPPTPMPKLFTRREPLPEITRDQGYPPGSEVLSARLYSDPRLFWLIVTGHMPDLVAEWPELSRWWFLRYRDPHHHLRLRLHVRDYGQAVTRVGRWAAALRRQGLAGDLLLDTYRPETGRFGSGKTMSAAEALFAADSAAASAQLASTGDADAQALTAASLADFAGTLLGGRLAGLRWLADHPRPAGPVPMDRAARLAAVAMTSKPADNVPASVRQAWDARADAAVTYAARADEDGRDVADAVSSLLHLHHNRVHGYDPATEAATYRLARAAALALNVPRPATVASSR